MSANEPLHLGPPLAMGCDDPAPARCERCDDNFLHVRRFAGKFACEPCIRAAMCKDCKQEWAAAGSDSCFSCDLGFYLANPDEFDDALPVLRLSDWGQRLIQQVLRQQVVAEVDAENYEAASALLQKAITHRRVA